MGQQVTINIPTMANWRTTLFGVLTAVGGSAVQYYQNGGLNWKECAVAAIWAGACYLMADGKNAPVPAAPNVCPPAVS